MVLAILNLNKEMQLFKALFAIMSFTYLSQSFCSFYLLIGFNFILSNSEKLITNNSVKKIASLCGKVT